MELKQTRLFAIMEEFRTFISRGNVIDLAVAVIMGQAFTSIVTSIVKDILTPIIGVFLGGVEFSDLAITLGHAEIRYGAFIQATINFVIVALVVFALVKAINRLQTAFLGKQQQKEKDIEKQLRLLTEIRDTLKSTRQN